MVDKWSQLGFVRSRPDPRAPENSVYVETERATHIGVTDREWFYVLQHASSHPQEVAAARALIDKVLGDASQFATTPDCPHLLRPFAYDSPAFHARLQAIYLDLVNQADQAEPAVDPTFKSRESVIERIRQMAPFNLLDGAWLRGITPAGPISDVHALLFEIWSDEVGNGDPALNHSNMYRDLLHEVGLYLPPVDSIEFAQSAEILDSAYTVPAFELAISLYSEQYLPELLGMSLQLEWEVLGTKPTVGLFEYFDLNPQFYSMHIGIDNAASGHGAKARDAVIAYLEAIRTASGDAACQELWSRVWNGYVAFSVTGTLGTDLRNLVLYPPSLEERMIRLVERKAPFARLNHGHKMLGSNSLNSWFSNPPGLLDELVTSGLIAPGSVEDSSFFKLMLPSGPMYKVFTDEEIDLWSAWTVALIEQPEPPALSPLEAMAKAIEFMRHRQTLSRGHLLHIICGPDPQDPQVTLERSVAWWFTQPTRCILAAIGDRRNKLVIPYQPGESYFVTHLLAHENEMGRAFSDVIPGTGGKTGRAVSIDWISAGCPISDARPPQARVALSSTLLAMPEDPLHRGAHLPPRVIGMGAVH